jgi:restriction endonuclease S subunit
MNLPINLIATVSTGVYAKPTISGDAVYLQSSMYNEFGEVNPTVEPNVILDKSTSRHLLKEGDVLMVAKGAKNLAMVYDSKIGKAIASSTFLILRLMKKESLYYFQTDPAYVAWYLNHPSTQAILKAQAKGSSIQSISKKSLEELEIPIPSLERQRQILKLQELRNRERRITQRLDQLREHLLQYQLLQATNN